MVQYFHREQINRRQRRFPLLLGLVWASGFATGGFIHCVFGSVFFPWMRGIIFLPVSIVGLFCAACFPFLFSVFAVYLGLRWLLYPVCFGKALIFSLISSALWVHFGTAGWLAWLLIMFNDVISLPLLYRYWLRYISGLRPFSIVDVLLTVSCLLIIGSVDYYCISPFLATLSF